MPNRNAIKEYGEGEYYHLYNRGVAKMTIFRDDQDYAFFLSMLKTYLSTDVKTDTRGRELPNFREKVDLAAFCLMPNHYHLLVYLKERDGIEKLLRSIMTRYSVYFNKKYDRTGGLFEGRFLASRISSQEYFLHISRYIHLNALDVVGSDYTTYAYSSVRYFLENETIDWLHPELVWDEGSAKYKQFLQDYEDVHDTRKALKHELAHE